MANALTPEQIAQILEEFFKTVGARQYIGARYVPLFGRKDEESIEWDNTKPYEPLTIVLYQGNSYTSRQYVPAGVQITNEEFWAITGNYNAQIEEYRRETARALQAAQNATQGVSTLNGILPASEFSAESTVKAYIDAKAQDAEQAVSDLGAILPASEFSAENTVKGYVDYTARSYSAFGKRDVSEFLGTTVHTMNAAECQRYAGIGIRRLRTDLTWAEIETQRGVYDFSRFDALVETAEANDMQLLFILDYNNTLYADSASEPIVDETNLTAFANFVSAAVSRYQGKGIDWEIWNEPNHTYTAAQYTALVAQVAPIIRSLDATGNALVGSIAIDGENSLTWWDACCAAGILAYADKLSIHIYDAPTPERKMLVHLRNYTAITAWYNTTKRHLPWVITEIGYNTYSGTPDAPTDVERGAYELRQIMLAMTLGIDSLYIYEARSSYSGTNSEAYFGLFINGVTPTETANIISGTMNELIDKKFCGSYQAPDGRYCLDFISEDAAHTYVSWNATGAGRPSLGSILPDGCIPQNVSLYEESLYLIKAGVKNLGTHAETFNDSNTATGRYGHAEGQGTTSSGLAAHSEGMNTVASSSQAHAEGYGTTASGQWSHAGGNASTAAESNSFAHGNGVRAGNTGAVAFGNGTQTGRDYQFVCGQYNAPADAYVFSIGGGTSASDRKNIFSITRDGKLRIPSPDGTLYYVYVNDSGQLVASRTV